MGNLTGQGTAAAERQPVLRVVAGGAVTAAIVASGTCLALHVTLLLVADGSQVVVTLPMLLLALGCSACAVHLARSGLTTVDLVLMVMFSAAMVVVHLVAGSGHHGHDAMEMTSTGRMAHGGADVLMHVGVSLAVVQCCLAGLALVAGRLAGR